jgi:hypothetical protein
MTRDNEINMKMHGLGNFHGIKILLRSGTITPDEAASLRRYAFKQIGEKVQEIRREIARLQGVVQTLDSICLRGSQIKPAGVGGGEVAMLRQTVQQLHGWTVSLVESDYELLAKAEDPNVAAEKFRDLALDLQLLRMDRQIKLKPISGKGRISV